MIVTIFRNIFLLIPGVFLHFGYMICTGIKNQITILLNPAQLELDPVQDLHFLVGFYEIIEASMEPLILSKLNAPMPNRPPVKIYKTPMPIFPS